MFAVFDFVSASLNCRMCLP